jgi:Na+/alanine symporter
MRKSFQKKITFVGVILFTLLFCSILASNVLLTKRGKVSMNPNMESYKIFVDIFKGYLDTALTANIWFYALTGAVATYYLSNKEGKPFLKFSLFLPFALGIMLLFLSYKGIRQARDIEKDMLKDVGDLPLADIPAVEILVNFFVASLILISSVCVGLVLLFFEFPKFIFKN